MTAIPDFGKTYELKTDTKEFGRYMWALVLYCAGRLSYAPSICESVMLRNASIIADPWRALIVSHIEGAFARSFQTRFAATMAKAKAKASGDPHWWSKGYMGGDLGSDYDEDGWMVAVRKLERADVEHDIPWSMWEAETVPVTATFDDVDDFWFMVGSAIRHDLIQDEGAVMTAEEHTAFVKGHASDLNPKWVSNLWRDVTDDFWCRIHGDEHILDCWEPLRRFLEDVSTPESREPFAERERGGTGTHLVTPKTEMQP